MKFKHGLAILAFALITTACGSASSGSSNSGSDQPRATTPPGDMANNEIPGSDLEDSEKPGFARYIPEICRADNGKAIQGAIAGQGNRRQALNVAGETIVFEIYQPSIIDCDNIHRGAHPLILQGHGLEGSRETSKGAFRNLRDAGYAVISIDQRGFGQSTGRVNVMDPDLEGQALLAILDYAEENLDYLAWRDESTNEFVSRPASAISEPGQVNLVVGSTGFSYGGGFQFLLQNIDPKQRLDALAPEYTWHDLRYSLNPGDTVKSIWINLIAGVGETNVRAAQLQNPADLLLNGPSDRGLATYIREALIKSQLTNVLARDVTEEFRYHSPSYWCELNGEAARPYELRVTDPLPITIVGPDPEPNQEIFNQNGVDVLLSQGMRDVLFNFNEAWWNWQCMKQRATDSEDVVLMTHQYGHIVPVVQTGFLESFTGNNACADLRVTPANKVFFDEKLKNEPPHPSLDLLKERLCFSLSDNEAVYVRYEDVMAPRAPGIPASQFAEDYQPVDVDVSGYRLAGTRASVFDDDFTINGIASIFSSIVPQSINLLVANKEMILAGIPQITVDINPASRFSTCNILTPCDSIVFVGLGKRSPGESRYKLIDDQVTPIRGLGRQVDLEMVGIAEKLEVGDELALLVYGSTEQFFASASRDLRLSTVNIKATVKVPVYDANSPLLIRRSR